MSTSPVDMSVPFIVTAASMSIQSLLDQLPADRVQRQGKYIVFPATGGYVIVRWSQVESLADEHGGDAHTLIGQLKGLPAPVQAQIDADTASLPAVIVSNSQVVRVLADERQAVPPPVLDPFAPWEPMPDFGVLGGGDEPDSVVTAPATNDPAPAADDPAPAADDQAPAVDNRVINATIAGHDKTKPLRVATVYELRFNVAPPDVASLVVKKDQLKVAKYTTQAMNVFRIVIDGGDDFALWSADECKLYVPKQGNSKGSASFNIEPKHEGDANLNAFIFLDDTLLQQWTFTFQVVNALASDVDALASDVNVLGDDEAVTITKKGVEMSSASNLVTERRSQNVNLVITPLESGYNALLLGGTVTRARLSVTTDNVNELVLRARAALKEAVYTDKTNTGPYLRGIDIPGNVKTSTLNALAEIGSELFQTVFFGPDTSDDAHTMGQLLQEYGAKNSLRIQIAAEKFIFPWTLVYDKDLDGDADWEGFWGFKHIVEYLPLAPGTVTSFDPRIVVQDKLPVTFIANKAIDTQMRSPIIAGQEEFFATQADKIDLTERTTVKDFLADLNNADLPAQMIYLYCHAESYAPGEKGGTTDSKLMIDDVKPENALLVRQMITRAPYTRARLKQAPLIFLNACQGAEVSPALYSGLVPYFVTKGARGVIGTEVDTPALFAAEFAKRFFPRFLAGDETLGEVILALRREFVEKHNNVMGLVYAMYCNSDVCIVHE